MHEGSIAKSIIENCITIIEKEGLQKVSKINIAVGKIHAVVPSVLEDMFNIMKMDYSVIAQSKLVITELDVKIRCKTCKKEFILDEPFFICMECGSLDIDVIQGNELHITSIQGEDKPRLDDYIVK